MDTAVHRCRRMSVNQRWRTVRHHEYLYYGGGMTGNARHVQALAPHALTAELHHKAGLFVLVDNTGWRIAGPCKGKYILEIGREKKHTLILSWYAHTVVDRTSTRLVFVSSSGPVSWTTTDPLHARFYNNIIGASTYLLKRQCVTES